MKLSGIVAAIFFCIMCISSVFATTFILQSLDQLDEQADYIVIGTVTDQKSMQENKTIVTQTTIDVDEWLKGFSLANEVNVKEMGGQVGDIMMIVPGSPSFEKDERVALFMKEDQPMQWRQRIAYGHTVGMAQGKFSIKTDADGNEIMINDFEGANLLVGKQQEPILFSDFYAKYKQNLLTRFFDWLFKVVM